MIEPKRFCANRSPRGVRYWTEMHENNQMTALPKRGSHSAFMILRSFRFGSTSAVMEKMVRQKINRELTQTEIRIL
jgi:hypothetical protein